MARPTKFTEELGDEICSMVVSGMPLVRICELDHMPDARTVYRWFREHELFCQNYARAKEDQADYFVEDILQIADMAKPDDVQVARLRVDTRKWAASKYKPKKYGDKIQTDVQPLGKDGLPTDSMVALLPVDYAVLNRYGIKTKGEDNAT